MNARTETDSHISASSRDRISYVQQMLGQLTQVARAERADLLVYLLEMAFTEAGDILSGHSGSGSGGVDRNKT
eukprot:gene1461-1950_t